MIDLTAAEKAVEAGTALDDPALADKPVVFIDHFEHRLKDAGFNRAKRLLREAMRSLLPSIATHLDLILIARPGLATATLEETRQALLNLLKRAQLLDTHSTNES